jgi:hypothetical protein
MLLVTAEQVKYCQLIYSENNELHIIDGMSYGEKLFTKQHSFPKTKKQSAIEKAKVMAVENKGQFLIILVEESSHYDIWQENNKVKIKSQQVEDISINDINLAEVVAKMRNDGGIKIENRRYRLTIYKSCFIGREAVIWLMTSLKLSRKNAILLGQRLVKEKWIHHVTDEHTFKDQHLFYRFYEDEQPEDKQEENLLDPDKIKKFFSLS